jgi:hypothetical protein
MMRKIILAMFFTLLALSSNGASEYVHITKIVGKDFNFEKWRLCGGVCEFKLPRQIGNFHQKVRNGKHGMLYAIPNSDAELEVWSYSTPSNKPVYQPIQIPLGGNWIETKIDSHKAGISEVFIDWQAQRNRSFQMVFRHNDVVILITSWNTKTYRVAEMYLEEIGLGILKLLLAAPNKSLQPTPPAPLQSPALQSATIHF